MIITIHRGSHEIGGTCVELASKGGTRILLDLGQPLPPLEEGLVPCPTSNLPAVQGLYATEINERPLDGLLVSHAHQDHYGLMKNLHPGVKSYMSEPTRKLIEISAAFTGNGVCIGPSQSFQSGKEFRVGEFTITPFLVDHSAFDAHAFLIEDAEHRVFYSGDFRAHGRKATLFDRFVANPPVAVDMLLMEGTMMARVGEACESEQELERKIATMVKAAKGLVLSSVSGQNIDRLVTLYRVAKRTNRVLVIDPYIAHILDVLATFNPALPHLSPGFVEHLGVFYPRRLSCRMRRHLGLGHVLDHCDAWRVKPAEMLLQPEKFILLVRDNMVPELELGLGKAAEGALFLYGLWKGYWDKLGMQQMNAWVAQANMEFHYAHTSGHAMTTDLQRLVLALQPKLVVPIHTTCPEEYAAYFDAPVRVAQDGAAFSL